MEETALTVQDDPHRPEINPGVILPSTHHLRGHVQGGASQDAVLVPGRHVLGEAKICAHTKPRSDVGPNKLWGSAGTLKIKVKLSSIFRIHGRVLTCEFEDGATEQNVLGFQVQVGDVSFMKKLESTGF